MNSSGWKHTVEQSCRALFGDVWSADSDPYVCNGLFLLAALACDCVTPDDLQSAQDAGEMSVCPRLSDKVLRSAFDLVDGDEKGKDCGDVDECA